MYDVTVVSLCRAYLAEPSEATYQVLLDRLEELGVVMVDWLRCWPARSQPSVAQFFLYLHGDKRS